MPVYPYSQLKTLINGRVKGKIGILADVRSTLNEVARQVVSEVDLRSTRRSTLLTPPLFTQQFEYVCPTDLKDYKLINVDPQTDRKRVEYELVPSEQFYRRQDPHTVAITDADFGRKLLLNAVIDDLVARPSTLDSLIAGGGTWEAFGDGTNLTADSDNYVRGAGSLKWDISAAGGTTAGVKNTALSAFDLTDYLGGNGALFVWVYITSTTDLTNFILRLGSSESAYYSKTITAQSDGTALVNGWNLLRFDLTSLTETGTVDDGQIDFIALYMTKAVGKVSETSYRFDDIVIRRGELHNVRYYSKYPWQSSAGVYKENSTGDTDLLNVDLTEFSLMVEKGVELVGQEVDEIQAADRAAAKYEKLKQNYQRNNPSEAKDMISTVADFIDM